MFDKYEEFKKEVLKLTNIDLNFYKEKQMRRRIDTLATKNGCTCYEEYVKVIKADKEKFEQFVNFLTINVSEFYRNPDEWKAAPSAPFPGAPVFSWPREAGSGSPRPPDGGRPGRSPSPECR